MRKSILRCSVSSFEESMAILRGNVNRRRFSRQLRKPKLEQKKEYNTVTRTLRSRAGAKTVRRVHGENRDLELRRSCSVGRSRYSTTNSSILFDKPITNTAEVLLQKMAEMEQMHRCQRCWEDVEENLDIFTCVKSDFERTGPGSPDEIVRQRDRERTNSGQPHSVRQKESLENAGSQKCRRRARQRRADDISDSTPSCSSPLLSTCDTEDGGESSEDGESISPRRLLSLENRGGMNLLQMNI
ncbi:ATPase family AAA domain-containing protein 2-like isoform X3 [Anas acuta]|uniref:ATPase family AAA domain-containing protein 2-like isoform X3 n=1 Tax=Anas acuta TaxID=28680 RepID=UPI0035C90976